MERATGNGQRATGNGQRETGNGKRETGNGKRETGNGKRESRNECTAVIPIRIQNGGRNDVNTDMKVVSTTCRLQTEKHLDKMVDVNHSRLLTDCIQNLQICNGPRVKIIILVSV